MISIRCVGFASLDVVCDELDVVCDELNVVIGTANFSQVRCRPILDVVKLDTYIFARA